MPDSYEKFIQESVEKFGEKLTRYCGPALITGGKTVVVRNVWKIVRILAAFSALEDYLTIQDFKTADGPDAFNSVSFDSRSGLLRIGSCFGNEKTEYRDSFELAPKELYLVQETDPARSMLILTNQPFNHSLDTILNKACEIHDYKNVTIRKLRDVINPLLIIPQGSDFYNFEYLPPFVEKLVEQEELKHI